MRRRTLLLATTIALSAAMTAGVAQAAGPTRTTEAYTERFFDDFLLELCGIETFTTITERWTVKEYPDGSSTLHVVRTFVSDDPRIPIEKGAATSFFAPDGTQTVVGMPLLLRDRHGGMILIGAGWVEFGETITTHGRSEPLEVDLADYYCP